MYFVFFLRLVLVWNCESYFNFCWFVWFIVWGLFSGCVLLLLVVRLVGFIYCCRLCLGWLVWFVLGCGCCCFSIVCY